MKSNITSTVPSSGSSYSADGTAIATNHIDDVGPQTINRSYHSNESDASQVSNGNNLQMQSESRKVIDGFSENRNQRTHASALMSNVGDDAQLRESSKNIFSPAKCRDANSNSSGSSSIGRNDSPSRAIAQSSVRVASDDLYSRALDGRLKSLSEPKIRDSDCKAKNSFLSTPAVAATGSGSESSSIMGEVSGKVEMISKGSKLLAQGQSNALTAPQQKPLSATSIVALVVAYISVVAASYMCGVHPPLDYSNPVSQSPWIGEHNATKLINQRLQLIEARYQKVLVRDDWKMLRMSPNVTIETMSSEDGTWPGYIRTSAIFQAKPDDIMKYLGWLQFDETQKKVDRFHESSHLLFAPSHKSKVIRKVSWLMSFSL